MRILTFTTLYPNAADPNFAIFVENRLRHLVASGSVEARVVAPVPWFPFRSKVFGRYARFAAVPHGERRFGIEIIHPRYPLIPKIGMMSAPTMLYVAIYPVIAKVIESGYNFDLIDAHYFYPEGVAATLLGRKFQKPVTITARGSDINRISRYRLPRRQMRWAARHAAGLIAVSAALKRQMVAMGMEPGRIRVLRNGVDLAQFTERGRKVSKKRLGLKGTILLSVGNLIPLKGHDLVIRALKELPDSTLVIAGSGPDQDALKGLEKSLGLEGRVRFLGSVAHRQMADVYRAADVLVLASQSEGWPNVLLEAMACGTPVVATDVGGIAEVLSAPAAGRLLTERTPLAIAQSVSDLLASQPDRAATRSHAERFSWDETTQGQQELFEQITSHLLNEDTLPSPHAL